MPVYSKPLYIMFSNTILLVIWKIFHKQTSTVWQLICLLWWFGIKYQYPREMTTDTKQIFVHCDGIFINSLSLFDTFLSSCIFLLWCIPALLSRIGSQHYVVQLQKTLHCSASVTKIKHRWSSVHSVLFNIIFKNDDKQNRMNKISSVFYKLASWCTTPLFCVVFSAVIE